jgi:hypothetical protein
MSNAPALALDEIDRRLLNDFHFSYGEHLAAH